jgi:hypothetical protein
VDGWESEKEPQKRRELRHRGIAERAPQQPQPTPTTLTHVLLTRHSATLQRAPPSSAPTYAQHCMHRAAARHPPPPLRRREWRKPSRLQSPITPVSTKAVPPTTEMESA